MENNLLDASLMGVRGGGGYKLNGYVWGVKGRKFSGEWIGLKGCYRDFS